MSYITRDAGPNIRIGLSDKDRELVVEINEFEAYPCYRPKYSIVARFTNEQAWKSSSFASRVTVESVQDAIEWFWIDLQASEPQSVS